MYFGALNFNITWNPREPEFFGFGSGSQKRVRVLAFLGSGSGSVLQKNPGSGFGSGSVPNTGKKTQNLKKSNFHNLFLLIPLNYKLIFLISRNLFVFECIFWKCKVSKL
jgi:hypothetical protein